jgi:uncharacterized membrane protein YphA (DoxX/SURF4 family)
MAGYNSILRWQWAHNSLPSDLIRIFLGAALFVRGVLFLKDPSMLADISNQTESAWQVQYIAYSHLLGGLLLAAGLFTRVAALIQIPVLGGAVFLVHIRDGLFTPSQSVELSALVLFLLLVILVFGPGKASMDYYFFGRKKAAEGVAAG